MKYHITQLISKDDGDNHYNDDLESASEDSVAISTSSTSEAKYHPLISCSPLPSLQIEGHDEFGTSRQIEREELIEQLLDDAYDSESVVKENRISAERLSISTTESNTFSDHSSESTTSYNNDPSQDSSTGNLMSYRSMNSPWVIKAAAPCDEFDLLARRRLAATSSPFIGPLSSMNANASPKSTVSAATQTDTAGHHGKATQTVMIDRADSQTDPLWGLDIYFHQSPWKSQLTPGGCTSGDDKQVRDDKSIPQRFEHDTNIATCRVDTSCHILSSPTSDTSDEYVLVEEMSSSPFL